MSLLLYFWFSKIKFVSENPLDNFMLANLSKIYFRHGPVEDEMGREGREEEGG